MGGDTQTEEQVNQEVENIEDINLELEITALKFAKLLAAKEEQIKDNLKNYIR